MHNNQTRNMQTVIDHSCGSAPAFDETYIYYQGGMSRNQLWRQRKDLTTPATMIHPYCGDTPVLDGEYIYFLGGLNHDTLVRKLKTDDADHIPITVIAPVCHGIPVIDGDYIYYRYNDNSLMRKMKDGSTRAEMVDDYCLFPPVIDGDYLYLVGGITGSLLFRKNKHQPHLTSPLIVATCCLTMPTIDHDFIYYLSGPDHRDTIIYRQYKDERCHTSYPFKIDTHAAAMSGNNVNIQPLIVQEFILFVSAVDHNCQLCTKWKTGEGSILCLGNYCGCSPKLDDQKLYFLTSSTFHVLVSISLPRCMMM